MPRIPHFIFTMDNKKAQMDMRELVITLVTVGILFIVGLLIFSAVKNAGDNITDPDISKATNETIAIQFNTGADNSTLLAQLRVLENTEIVANLSNASEIVNRNVDYKITLDGASGVIGTRANFTWLTGTGYNWSNTTGVVISYRFNSESEAQATSNTINTTVLDSFSLGVIALIVLAAIVILGILFKLGSQ